MNEMDNKANLQSNHWTADDLLDRLYGLDPRAGLSVEHLTACGECSRKLAALESHRAVMAAGGTVSEERMRAQRQVIFDRIEAPSHGWMMRFAPVAATAFLLVLGVTLQRPEPIPPAPITATAVVPSDEELFASVALLVEDDTPRAIDPIRGLFASQTTASEVH